MAHTHHHHNRGPSARWYNKEAKDARKATTRALRRANRALAADVRTGRADAEAVAFPTNTIARTQGHLTH